METNIYFSPELLKIAEENIKLSPSTAHKIMNPFCPVCMKERRQRVIEELKKRAASEQD